MSDKPSELPKPAHRPQDPMEPHEDMRLDGRAPLNTTGSQGAGKAEPTQEVEIWIGRTHWKHYAGRLALWALANALLVVALVLSASHVAWLRLSTAIAIAAGTAAVTGLIVWGGVLLRLFQRRYRLTNQRLFIERGILNQTVDQTELIRVDDVRLFKTPLNRLFGLGSIVISSTDASDSKVTIEGIQQPEQIAEAIRSNMWTLRRRSLFIEQL
ncbi:MAG: PH domain-containing protein [Phycisphaerae bacterium]